MKLARSAALALVFAVAAGSCIEHDATTERVGGPLPIFDAAPADSDGPPPVCVDQGCETEPPTGTSLVTWCQALTVIQKKCQPCHADPPKNDAPFPIVTFANTRRCYNDKLVHERMKVMVETGQMPFVELNEILGLNPPVEDLTADEHAILMAWFEQGACAVGGTTCPPN